MRKMYSSRTDNNTIFWLEKYKNYYLWGKIIQNKDIHMELREKHQRDCGSGGTNV